jgi:hypothetical protein
LQPKEHIMTGNSFRGRCLCGAVTYAAAGEPALVAQCHCLDCQKATGAGHVSVAVFPEGQVAIDGKLKSFKKAADSGALFDRQFCPECGSLIAGRPGSAPGMVALTLATMDESPDVQIKMRFFDGRRRSWDVVDPAIPAFPGMPPR